MSDKPTVVEGNFPQQHEHCWHGVTTTLSRPIPLHCCYCNEKYDDQINPPTGVSAPKHGPWA